MLFSLSTYRSQSEMKDTFSVFILCPLTKSSATSQFVKYALREPSQKPARSEGKHCDQECVINTECCAMNCGLWHIHFGLHFKSKETCYFSVPAGNQLFLFWTSLFCCSFSYSKRFKKCANWSETSSMLLKKKVIVAWKFKYVHTKSSMKPHVIW